MSETKDAKKGKAKIEIVNHPEFPLTDRGTTMSTIEMDKQFKLLIGSVFEDIFGVRPSWNLATGRLTVSLFFDQAKHSPDAITAFKVNAVDGSTGGLDRINRFFNLNAATSMFYLTDEAKEALAPFMADDAKNRDGSIRWESLDVVTQAQDNVSSFGMSKAYNVINYLNPVALLKAIYGDKAKGIGTDDEGNYSIVERDVDYTIEIKGIQIPQNNGYNNSMLFNDIYNPQFQMSQAQMYNEIMNKVIITDPLILKIYQIDTAGTEAASNNLGIRYQNNLKIDQ